MAYDPLHPFLPNGSVFTADHIAHFENGILEAVQNAQNALDGVSAGVDPAVLEATKTDAISTANTYTDTKDTQNRSAWAVADEQVLAAANQYTAVRVDNLSLSGYATETFVRGRFAGESIANDVNLDTVTAPGRYYRAASAGTSTALNYPVAKAGHLDVLNWGTSSLIHVYTPWDMTGYYTRRLYAGEWSVWTRYATADQVIADIQAATAQAVTDANTYTNQAEADAVTAANTYTDAEVGEDRARLDYAEARLPEATEADYAHAFTDADGLVAFGVKTDGTVDLQGTAVEPLGDTDGYLHAFGDSAGKIALGIRDDGTVEAGGEVVATKTGLRRTAWVLTVSGGGGAATGEDARPSVTARIPVASGADFRVRSVRVRNYNDRSGLAYTGELAFTGIYFGEHAQDSSGALTGNFKTTPALVSGPFATPADGSAVTVPADFTVEAGKEYLFSYGYTGAGTPNHQGIGGCWTTNSAADASATTVTATKAKFAPLDLWFEIETEAPINAWVGDSLSCGVSSELPVYHSVPMVHARANGYIPLMYTHSGSLMTSWTNTLAVKYTKWAGLDKPDALVFSLGKNDLINATDTATLRTRFSQVYPIVTGFTTGNLYVTTILPSNDDSTSPAGVVRREWNNILRNELLGNTRMVFDFSATVSDPSTGNLRPEFDSGDGVHLNKRGYMELARTVNQTL